MYPPNMEPMQVYITPTLLGPFMPCCGPDACTVLTMNPITEYLPNPKHTVLGNQEKSN